MCTNEKVFPDNVYSVWSMALCLRDSLTLPDSVATALDNTMSVCEPYIKDGFTYQFELEE